MQRDDRGAGRKRARYNSSVIDADIAEAGKQFENLPETYVIFITENDVLKGNLPLYHIDRIIRETGEFFMDEEHIIYVNAQITDETELGRLMHDFWCTNPSDMKNNILAQRVRYFKEEQEGVMAVSYTHLKIIMEKVGNTENVNVLVDYTSPTIVLGSIALLIFFVNIRVDSTKLKQVITVLSGATLGVYLIHDNGLIRNEVVAHLFEDELKNGVYKWALVKLIIVVPAVYVICCLMDLIRSKSVSYTHLDVYKRQVSGSVK